MVALGKGSYSLVLAITHEEWRGALLRGALDLNVIVWSLVLPVMLREVTLLDEQVGERARHVIIDNI